jgi:alpha-galactosidase
VLEQIRGAGFEPALWVAPFIASPQSKLFTEHPDWFVQDDQGHPLRSDTFTFGGWRLGPWYMLDGTHPAAQQYLTQVFRALREQWGCTYFKLDANAWGAFAQGRRYADEATSVEAYRQGMAAIRRGAGDAFLLGCNHPLWPSIGEIHGSRSSRDIQRSWEAYRGAARENLMRNWQNNSLWWNDPDCLVLGGKPTAAEESFHIVATYASGGMLLSGDDLTRANDQQLDVIRQCLRNPGVAARFENDRLEIGRIRGTDHTVVALLNWGDQQAARLVEFDQPARAHDLLTGEDLGTPTSPLRLVLPGRSGRLLKMTPLRSVSQ